MIPDNTFDVTRGFKVNDILVHNGGAYVCTDNTPGRAVWKYRSKSIKEDYGSLSVTAQNIISKLEAGDDVIIVINPSTDKIRISTSRKGNTETNLIESNEVKFDEVNQYGSIASPRTGDITVDFTDAKLGVVQVMFHVDKMPPETLSNSKFIILQGRYTLDVINRISFELVDKTVDSEVILLSMIPIE